MGTDTVLCSQTCGCQIMTRADISPKELEKHRANTCKKKNVTEFKKKTLFRNIS